MYTIYALVDPRDNTIRYVGLTDNVYRRFKEHITCDGCNPRKDAWIVELELHQVVVIMRSLEYVNTIEEARESENYWIRHYQERGASLLNQDAVSSFTFEDFLTKMGHEVSERKTSNRQPRVKKPSQPKAPLSMTVKEAAQELGLSQSYIRELRTKGRLKTPTRNKRLITVASVKSFQAMRQSQPLETLKGLG